MNRTKQINVKVSKEVYNVLKTESQRRGYRTLSSYASEILQREHFSFKKFSRNPLNIIDDLLSYYTLNLSDLFRGYVKRLIEQKKNANDANELNYMLAIGLRVNEAELNLIAASKLIEPLLDEELPKEKVSAFELLQKDTEEINNQIDKKIKRK